MRTLALAVVAILGMGCATTGGPRHQATRGIVVAHTTLSALQDGEMALVCGRAGSPAPPACVPGDLHRKISGYLAEAFEYDGQVAALIRDVPEGRPTPVQALSLIGKIGAIVARILAELPKSPQQEQLAATLGAN